jgi:hypothetical protein
MFEETVVKFAISETAFADDLETTLRRQTPANIWFEVSSNNDSKVVQFSDETTERISLMWTQLIDARLIFQTGFDTKERLETGTNVVLAELEFNRYLAATKLEFPDGERRLTKDEVEEVREVFHLALTDKIEEIDDHFNPKSQLFKIKRSVDKACTKFTKNLLKSR